MCCGVPGLTFTLSDTRSTGSAAYKKCKRRGRLRKARLIEQYGPDYGVAGLRETLIADCPKFGTTHAARIMSG